MEIGASEQAQGAIIVQDRSSLTAPNTADMEILAKLDEKLRFIEQKKVAVGDPTYYLALDHISVANATALESAVKKVTDMQNGGKNRVAYLYPMLVSHHSKPAFQLFLFYPPKNANAVRDAGPLRRAAFSKSEPLFRSLLEAKRAKPTDVEEEDPGAPLIKFDGKNTRFYPDFFSLEYDFRRLLKKSYDKLQMPYIEIPDFFEDLREYFTRSGDLVDQIGDKYHIVIDQLMLDENGGYERTPEVIRHYRVLADGLEKFALNVLYDKAKKAGISPFVSQVDSYRATHVVTAEPGRKQSKEKVDALMQLTTSFPFDAIRDKEMASIRDKVTETTGWLNVLIEKKDKLVNRKHQQGVDNLLQKIENMVQTYSKQNLDLFQIDLRREILRAVKDEAQAMAMEADFEKRLMTRFGAYKVTASDGSNLYYFVDQRYMSPVLENLSRQLKTDASAGERYEIATQIYEQLVKRKDPALDQAISAEERINLSQMRAHNVNKHSEGKQLESRANRYNVPQGILVSLISAILFGAAMFYSTQLFWLVFPLTLISVVAFYRMSFGSRSKRKDASSAHSSSSAEPADETDHAAKQMHEQAAITRQKIGTYGSAMVFPFTPAKASERVLTEDEFRAKVKLAAPEIKKNVPELGGLDGKALEQAAYDALREESVCIVIPTEIVKKSLNKVPPALYINYKDFASDQIRTKIADDYRQIFKPNLKEYEQEFYRYLINTLEVKYYPYLKKNLKK
jgi:F0F1-type ATP synthase assembly protein I